MWTKSLRRQPIQDTWNTKGGYTDNKQEGLVQLPRIRTKIVPVGSHYNQGARRGKRRLYLRSVLEMEAKATPDQ
jgi:hypothetical protein